MLPEKGVPSAVVGTEGGKGKERVGYSEGRKGREGKDVKGMEGWRREGWDGEEGSGRGGQGKERGGKARLGYLPEFLCHWLN